MSALKDIFDGYSQRDVQRYLPICRRVGGRKEDVYDILVTGLV